MRRVRCQAELTVDAKGRLALPRPLRAALEEIGNPGLVLVFHKGALMAWTQAEFEERFEKPLAESDPFDDEVRDFTHALLSTAHDVQMDGQGRIRLPPKLRAYAHIDKDVVVHSIVGRVEIWDRISWERRFEESLQATRGRSGRPGNRE